MLYDDDGVGQAAYMYVAVHGMIFVCHLRQKSLNSVTILQYRAPIFLVVKIWIKSVKKDVMSLIILSWGT